MAGPSKVLSGLRVSGTVTTPVVGYALVATDTLGTVDFQAVSGGGGGGLAASGTPTVGAYTKWASSTTLTNTLVSESGSAVTVAGTLAVTGGALALSGTVSGRSGRSNAATVDATGQAGSGNVIGSDDSGITLKVISGQSAIFDNDGGLVSLPTSGAATIPAIYGGQNPAISNVGGATSGSNTVTLLVGEAIAAQGTLANATVTTLVGLDIGAMTGGATANYGLRIAAPSEGSTINHAIDVAGGAMFVDGAGNITTTGSFTAGSVAMNNNTVGTVVLRLQAASGQTANIQTWESNNGATLYGAVAGLFAASATTQTGLSITPVFNAPTAATIIGAQLGNGTFASNGATPTVTELSTLKVGPMTAGAAISATTTITNFFALNVPAQGTLVATGTATATNAYGLFVNVPTITATNGPYTAMLKGGSVGVGTIASDQPTATLHVGGVATGTSPLKVANLASSSVALATFDASATTAGQVVTLDKTGHLAISQSAIPTTGSLGTGVTSATIASGSTDQWGKITFVVTTSQVAAANICTVTFKNAFAVAPTSVMLIPADSTTWAKASTAQYTVGTISTTSFIPKSGSTAGVAGTFVYYYYCF